MMPHTCELLLPEIPTKPGLPYVMPNNEEIVLFRSVGGAYVGPHTGAVNNQINIHLTLKGGEGVYLEAPQCTANQAVVFCYHCYLKLFGFGVICADLLAQVAGEKVELKAGKAVCFQEIFRSQF